MHNNSAPTKAIRAVLFDWDGTLVDSALPMLLSYRYAYRKHLGIHFPKDDAEFSMIVPMRLAESAAKYGGEHAADVAVAYNWFYEHEGYKSGRVFPGVEETLAELRRRGYLLGVASNKSRGRIDSDINYLALEGLVDEFATSEDTVQRKPDPAPLLKVAEKLGVEPTLCAYVGDYSGDIIAARAAGMVSVAVTWGGMFPVETLLAQSPHYVINKLEELLDIFTGVAEALAAHEVAMASGERRQGEPRHDEV
jgi:pyrophosphatase PpaX